jgi:hypothetical protein
MFKQFSLLAVVGLIFMVATETETWGQFGGYHGAAVRGRGVNVARGVNVGVAGAAYRAGGYRGVGYGGYGGYGYGYGRALPYGSTFDGYGNVILPPNPGQGPVGMDKITSKPPTEFRGGSQAALNEALNQMRLPSDAGLPAAQTAKPAGDEPTK